MDLCKNFSISFIRPDMFGIPSKDAMYPLVFAIVKHITPDNIKINFYDERLEAIPSSIDSDVIAISVETFSAKRAYILADRYKGQGKKVIMGGFHVTVCPDEALKHADSIIIGEIENQWNQVLEDLKNNSLKQKYETCTPVDLSNSKMDMTVFKDKKYNPVGLVQFSRGCKFACEFCSVHSFFKNTIRTKPIEKIVEEVKNTKEKYLFFIDDNLFSDEEKAGELFKALIPLKKQWCCQISIDVSRKPDLLKLMKKSGCFMVLIGFESLNSENLKQMGKTANIKNNDYKQVVKNIYDAGLMIYGTFLIGYDSDTKETANQLMEFALKNKFAIANFNPLMPMPGSLDCMGKRVNKIKGFDNYKWEIERLRYWGLQTWAAFTIGHDTDTVESIKATCEFALQNKFAFTAFNILMPYPNTPLYEQLKEEDRLLYDGKWWLAEDYLFNYAAFKPKNMTPEELTEVGFYCRHEFNKFSSLLKRMWEPRTNMASLERFLMYWFYNPIFKKEVYKKHGMYFGLNKYNTINKSRY